MIDLGKKKYSFDDLCSIMLLLRAPDGCPWDRAQNHLSIRRYFLEEAYEAVDAIDRQDDDSLREELGDVLLQVVFHGTIAEEQGSFTLDDVCDSICRKMIDRHPALFGGKGSSDWEAIKQRRYTCFSDAMNHIARALPALTRAEKIERKASEVGFVWPDIPTALLKVEEELDELRRSTTGDGNSEEELGDLLLAVADVGRMMGIDPERALDKANEKFITRFSRMEELSNHNLANLPLSGQMDLWRRAKSER